MTKLPRLASLYTAAALATAAACLVLFVRLPPPDRLPLFLGLGLATVLPAAYRRWLPQVGHRSALSPSFFINFISFLSLGAPPTMLIAAAGTLADSTVALPRLPLHRTLFKIARAVITVHAAGLGYRALGGSEIQLEELSAVGPVVGALVMYSLVSCGLVALHAALSTSQPVLSVWRHNFLRDAWSYFIGASVTAAVWVEMAGYRWWGLFALAIPTAFMTVWAVAGSSRRQDREPGSQQPIRSLGDGMTAMDRDGRVTHWDPALERVMGCSCEDVLGRPLLDAVPVLADTMVPQMISTVLASGEPSALEHVTLRSQTGRRILQVRVFPFAEGGVTVFWHDVTDQADAEDALRRSEERYASAFVTIGYLAASGANDALWDWDLVRKEVSLSARWRAMVGLPANVAYSAPEEWFERVHPDDRAPLRAALEAHIAGETAHFQHEHRIRHENGTYRWVLCRGVAVRRGEGRATRIAGAQSDITERMSAQEQLRHAALHDTLTALPNRSLFLELLAQVLERGKRHPEHQFAVLFLDVDRFKAINDSLGHLVGDELLAGVARRLESCLREGDVLARLGGDEFTILLNDLSHTNQASLIAERIQEVLRPPFFLAGRELFATASIGVALSAPDYSRPEEIMKDADTAMYRAKALGKARYELFDAGMHARAVDRIGFGQDLRAAIEGNELALHYQPLVSLASGEWTGFEALLRWERGGRVVAPTELIPVAEELGIIEPLATWVLQEACRQAATWRKPAGRGPSTAITVNVSTRQLVCPNFLRIVQGALEASALRPDELRLEISESVLMSDPERAEGVLRDLHRLGVKIYLDDFGTGFSSLSFLHRFPVDALKIDRSCVATLTEGSGRRPAIIESIVTLAKTLGIDVIAEGVETEGQVHELARLGCTEAQGFFFARPLPGRATETLLVAKERNDPQGPSNRPATNKVWTGTKHQAA